MKFNKKMVVATLSTALGLGIVGSISGTVAWYQYSTRSTAAFVGTTVKSTANLQISVDNGLNWHNNLTSSQIAEALANNDSKNANLSPITTGAAMEKNGALPASFKTNPVYQDFEYSKWGVAKATEYVQFALKLKYTGVDGGTVDAPISGKKIYLNDLVIDQHAGNTKKNISDAVRVHLDSTNDMLLSNGGQQTILGGNLDLGGATGDDDNAKWEWDTGVVTPYGDDSLIQKSYKLDEVQPTNTNGALSGGVVLGTTNNDGIVDVTVTIWLEGWQKLYNTVTGLTVGTSSVNGLYTKSGNEYTLINDENAKAADGVTYYRLSANWSEADYLNSLFHVGLEFIVERI